ncbi:M15 family metallopeptidase [Bizionia sediminis]|uniref:D-alanyl-D-alanine dipeptidase n=1 Tax=Bizionia sediminis TaxID=1737064 RepID=A0ABW5KVK2_9FLAO
MINKVILFVLILSSYTFAQKKTLPDGFVYGTDLIPNIDVTLRYFSTNNFVGDTITGYQANTLIVTKPTAEALKKVQAELAKEQLGLRVYDAYRPQRAVNHFIAWAKNLNDTLMKQSFYPKVEKQHLFRDGYIASKSGHSRGSTVDVTIIDLKTNKALDMGSPYDYFGEMSWVAHKNLTPLQKKNRARLQKVMRTNGFRNYAQEWWHFTLKNEPFPDTYFDFVVE